ncbi:putative Diguanylate cyclase with hemerythrin-like metal-binding domain [uncultured Alphaproteobacteria bacterium]|uniref:diguanylate cyclase n=1 Tax=uncultured Alphaproteobacteria bacterium TaxID=91750 RepID=A0A212KH13_9PROT|nr:putative Diguanylate cyclase with hemerythrin-like metal-binding domain [uncultured Alphaproteobacteria bacterium]
MFLQIHIPTIFAALLVVCIVLALPLALATKGADDGLKLWAAALGLMACAFFMLKLRGTIADRSLAIVGNLLIAGAMAALLAAVHRFQNLPPPRRAVAAPILLLAVALPLLPPDLRTRVAAVNATYLAQLLLVIGRLVRFRYDFPTRGRDLTVTGLGALAAVAAVRLGSALLAPAALGEFFAPSPVQSFGFFSALGGLILASTGFLMMAKERSDERLRAAARRDRLTGCWNRLHIEEAAAQEIARLRRYGHPVSAILVDLDHFKLVNDRHGHGAGDEVLAEFARVAQRVVRTTDVVGRWGGEEFLILLPMSDISEAAAIAERLRTAVETHIFPGNLRVTVSAGFAACLSTESWGEWLRRADTALYRAKADGRNRIATEGIEIVRRGSGTGAVAVPQLIWRASYLCGEETVDRQHRALFEKANALLGLGGGQAPKERIVAALRAFLDETRAHFADEERIIESAGYEDALDHARIHRELLARSEDLLRRYADDEIGDAALFHHVVHELFANHILAEDRAFRPLFLGEDADVSA